jgi:hypothetical protein
MTHTLVVRPAARRALTAAGVLTGLALVLAGTWLVGNLAARETRVVRTTYTNVSVLRIDAGGGDIELRPAPAGAPLVVEEHVTRGLVTPRRSNRLADCELRMRSECRGLPGPSCGVRYVVRVPRQTAVFATSGTGDVKADGLTSRARIELTTGSGEIRVRGVAAPALALETGDGGIGATGLDVATVRAQAGSGSIALGLRAAPGILVAESGSGDVVLTLPDRPYALTTSTGSGHIIDAGIRQDTTSPHKVIARAGSGDVVLSVGGR